MRTAGWAVLDGVLLAALSLLVAAFAAGGPAAALIQALVLAAYVAFARKKRAFLGMLAAVVLAAVLSGSFFVLTGRRRAAPQGPPPNPAMAAVVRSALFEYRAKHKGAYPSRLEDMSPELLAMVPEMQAPRHKAGNASEYYGAEVCGDGGIEPSRLRDTGRWGYVNDPKAPCWGAVFIDCVHLDGDGKPFYGY